MVLEIQFLGHLHHPELMSIWTRRVLPLTLLNNFDVNLGMLHPWLLWIAWVFLSTRLHPQWMPMILLHNFVAQLPTRVSLGALVGLLLPLGLIFLQSILFFCFTTANRWQATCKPSSTRYTTSTPLMITEFISHCLKWMQFTLLCTSPTCQMLKPTRMPNLPLLHIAPLFHPTVMLVGALRLVQPYGMEPYSSFWSSKHDWWHQFPSGWAYCVDLSLPEADNPQLIKGGNLSY